MDTKQSDKIHFMATTTENKKKNKCAGTYSVCLSNVHVKKDKEHLPHALMKIRKAFGILKENL